MKYPVSEQLNRITFPGEVSEVHLRYVIYLIVFITSIIGSQNARSADLVAGIFHLKPYGYLDHTQRNIGIIPSVLSELETLSGLKIQTQLYPYKRMVQELENNAIDFAIFFKTGKNLALATPLVKIHEMPIIVVGKKGLDIHTYADLSQHSIAVTLGVLYQDRFDNDQHLNKVPVPHYYQQFHLLKNGKVDLVTGSDIGVYYNMKKSGIHRSMHGKPYILNVKEVWLQMAISPPNGKKKAFTALKRAADTLRENGTINRIYHQFIE